MFCFFIALGMSIFLIFSHLLILEELRNLHAKIDTFSVKIDRENNFQSWILFFIDFSLMLQLCHSALFNNVQQFSAILLLCLKWAKLFCCIVQQCSATLSNVVVVPKKGKTLSQNCSAMFSNVVEFCLNRG